ncbi:TPA: RHS repeat-associated core domain-containing protein [Pseudomonas putida]|nr:RHS repeat-associated core domain-containing protein [Pseudomonas putida]
MTESGLAGKEQFTYTPYGRRPTQSESNNPLAFNGELLDSAAGGYLLGNGYRLFSPTLKRFCSTDNLSPFEQGGLNAYAYCAGDPVNSVDPSGHFSISSAFFTTATVAMVISAVAGIASLSLKSPEAKKTANLVMAISGGISVALLGGAKASKVLSQFLPSRPRASVPNLRVPQTVVNTSAEASPRESLASNLDGSPNLSTVDLPPAYNDIYPLGQPSSPPSYNSLFAQRGQSSSIARRSRYIRSSSIRSI